MLRKHTAVLVVSMLMCAGLAAAQTLERGDIHGIVYDPAHAVIPGAKLSLVSPSTGFQRSAESDANGAYNFAQVPPGNYEITATSPSFSTTKLQNVQLHVGSNLQLDVNLAVKGATEQVEVTAAAVDVTQAGVTELINSESVASIPLSGRDYRDLAQLTPSAQVVPGLRGGIRLGGQQSDYTGIVIDGGDSFNNSFGEFFGSLETKNFTIPLDAVQEFEVVTNGFAPEFGRSTGGLLNVVTKSGTNDVHGDVHYFLRHKNLTADDALGNPSNIAAQHQYGGAIGFPLVKDRQFLFLAVDRQQQHGPLITQFAQNVNGVAVPELGISNLASLEGSHNQFQNLFSLLGHYDYQFSARNHFSARVFFTRNHTNGFTGGRGQNETSAAFDNTENFHNQGVNSVFTLNTVFSANKLNELKLLASGETRPRHPNGNTPEVQINDTGTFGQRFFLPINGDNGKLQPQDNFNYVFGRHDMKFGGDVDIFFDRKDTFAGWSRGTYSFATLADFEARQPFGFIQGFGLNGQTPFAAGTLGPNHQIGIGLYWQDKWRVTDRFTLTYGLRWDGSKNPQPQSPTPGSQVYVGEGPIGPGGSHLATPPHTVPNDWEQFGPRLGLAYSLGPQDKVTLLHAALGYYYAQTPTIFLPTAGNERTATLFCFFNPSCLPPGGFPNLFPSTLTANDPLLNPNNPNGIGPPGINYVDPKFRNPRVANLTIGVEQHLHDWTFGATFAYSHSDRLRTGGFSTTIWSRNVVVDHFDQFGRAIMRLNPVTGFGPQPVDPSIGTANELGSFSKANYNEFVLSAKKSFAKRFQFFSSYTLSRNKDNASSERDTDTFFGPQDPFNAGLDYGINGLDIRHQFKGAVVATLPYGFIISDSIQVRSGLAYPAYTTVDTNNDAVSNQGVASNDRPVVVTSGGTFLLPRYPGRQPGFVQDDLRVDKQFKFSERYNLEFLVDLFNLTNRGNLYSNPDNSAFVDPVLSAIPRPGQPTTPASAGGSFTRYRTLDQISPGSLPFAAQLGLRLNF
jgi:hypothetical protein